MLKYRICRKIRRFDRLTLSACFCLTNALRALNDAKFTMVVSMLSMWLIRIGLSYVLAWTTPVGAMCSRIAMVVDWIARAIAFVIRFKRGKWTKRAVL